MRGRDASVRGLRELAGVFLKLGTIAFGGPAAHIAMMEDEMVRRRAWLSRQEFLDLIGAAALLPGPNSTEVALFVGQRRAGWRGLVLAGFCFILPAAVLVTGFAWAYVRFGSVPRAAGVLYGVKPVIVAVLVQALASFVRTAVKTRWLAAVCSLAAIAAAVGAQPVLVLVAAGVLGAAAARRTEGARALLSAWMATSAKAGGAASVGLGPLFLAFLKVGSILFGSGYVLLALLRADLVERLHWLSEPQLVDAVAVGQVTPGPVFTTATFIGYVLAGFPGAAVATVGVFLPSFLLVLASGHLIPRIRRSPLLGRVLDGVNAGSVALMAVVTATLALGIIRDVPTAVLMAASLLALWRWRVNSAWLVLAGAMAGALLRTRG
jgi:chromate transporter